MTNSDRLNVESASRLRAIIETAIDGIITIDEAGIMESINPAVTKIFGYESEELVGRNIKILMPEPYSSEHDTYMDNYQKTGVRKIIGIGREVQGKRKDGSVFPFLLSVSEIEFPDKKIFTGFVHDISALKKAEESLKVSEDRVNAIIQTAVDGIITINERGLIEMVNPSTCKLFGYTEDELLGKNVSVLMPEPEKSRHNHYMESYNRTGVGHIIGIGREVTGLRKDGTTFPFFLSISEVQLINRKVFTGFVHDITEQKLAEEKLRRYAKELERSNMELQDFAYVSSHDLQEPLRKIQAFGDRLKQKEAEKLSDQGKDYIDRMLNAASRMQSLINDLLTFSRVTTKSQPFVKLDLNNLLQDVLSDLEITITQANAKIIAEPLPVIEAEPTQIRQLFQNLIANAIKFRKEDESPVIKIYSKNFQRKAHLTSTPGDEQVEIYVEDNGIGFDEKYLDRIFNVFQRLEGQKYAGSGIGLAICKKIAIRHGGNITAHSQPGKGSVFIVTLSLKQTSES